MERALEQFVWRRAHDRCEYCQLSQENHELSFEIDHIRAACHGGATKSANLCLGNQAYLNKKTGMPWTSPLFSPAHPCVLRRNSLIFLCLEFFSNVRDIDLP
jgi:hypothetical protein